VFLVGSRWRALQQQKGHHQQPRQLDLLYFVVWAKEGVEDCVVHHFRLTRFQNLCVAEVSLVEVLVFALAQELALSLSSYQAEEVESLVEEGVAHVPSQVVEKARLLIHPSFGLGVVVVGWHPNPTSLL
jgi:hypothetical protein